MKMQLLSEKLDKHKGKKVYGYLNKDTKNLVNEIVKLLGKDEKIQELYDSWYGYKCETVRTYTDTMLEKIPIEENEEFKSIRNNVVRVASELGKLSDQPSREIDYDYSQYENKKDDFDFLYHKAMIEENPILYYRHGRYYLEKTDDMENAEYWLRLSADNGNSLSAYLIYKAYRDHKFDDTPSDKMKYLRMSADAGFGYAEYEYAKYLMDKSPREAMEYLKRASNHGSFQAEYAYGKILFEQGKKEEARQYFDKCAREDAWTEARVGLLYYYEYQDYEIGKELLKDSAEQGYMPAKEALKAIEQSINAQIVMGVCDLFYYASNIIEERCEDMYSREHQVSYHGIDRKQRKENQAKRHGMSW